MKKTESYTMIGDVMKIDFYNKNHFLIYDFQLFEKQSIKIQISKFIAQLVKRYNVRPIGIYQVIIRPDPFITIYEFNKTMDSFLEEMELKIVLLKNDILYEFNDFFYIQDKKDVYSFQEKFYKKEIKLSEIEYCNYIFGEKKEKIMPFLRKCSKEDLNIN